MNHGMNAQTKQSDEWQTPQWLYDALDHEFAFTMDGAATAENTKCKLYSTREALHDWSNQRVFCNPPYSNIELFVREALRRVAEVSVLLLPVRTDSDWFRLLIEREVEIRWLRKRVSFLENGVEQTSPRFTSLIAIVKGGRK
jgi:phage N-6-adenine-methyltransferase